MRSYTIFFEFQGRRVCLAIVTSEYETLDEILNYVEAGKTVTVGYLTSKALETPSGGFIYNFKPSWKLGLFENAKGVSNLLRSIQIKEAAAANTKVKSILRVETTETRGNGPI